MKEKISGRIILFGAIVSIVIVLLAIVIRNGVKDDNKVSFDKIDDIKYEEVTNVYENLTNVSCQGDMFFYVKLDSGDKTIDSLYPNEALNYIFSYLDKNNYLSDKIDINVIKKASKTLFYGNVDLIKKIKDYHYGDYVYNINGNRIIREKATCQSNHNYINYLYGYFWTDEELLMDVKIGELKGDTLYDLLGKEQGIYDGEISKLPEMLSSAPYYRYHYVKENNVLKLKSVEIKSTK